MLIDTHSHIDKEEDIEGLLIECEKNLVTEIIAISTDLESSEKNINLSSKYQNIFCAVGYHPGNIKKNDLDKLDIIENFGANDSCKAIGEIGIDYFYEGYDKDLQFEFFDKQISMAERLNKPFVIHCRDAYNDVINFLKTKKLNTKFVFHCFAEDYETAKRILNIGGLLSFTGILTFKKSHDLRELVKKIPSDSFMIETDSPYLSPEPKRGKKNNSSNLIYIAECVSRILNIPLEQIAKQIRSNSVKFFNI